MGLFVLQNALIFYSVMASTLSSRKWHVRNHYATIFAPDPLLYTTGLRVIQDNGGQGIPITKPRDHAGIIANLRQAEAAVVSP
jgi:hypothetical protein